MNVVIERQTKDGQSRTALPVGEGETIRIEFDDEGNESFDRLDVTIIDRVRRIVQLRFPERTVQINMAGGDNTVRVSGRLFGDRS